VTLSRPVPYQAFMKHLIVLLLLLFPAALLAQPTITSVTPSTGPIAGGTSVTIRGTGFQTIFECPILCFPAHVRFGSTIAAQTTIVDDTTIIAVTPVHAPGTVDVTFIPFGFGPSATAPSAFTFLDPSQIPALDPSVLAMLAALLGAAGSFVLRRT
jgi:hypothetical protein